MSDAARSGAPAMTTLRPPVPPTVPQTAAAGAGAFTGDVTATQLSGPSALDTKPDARANPPGAAEAKPDAAAPAAGASSAAGSAPAGSTASADTAQAQSSQASLERHAKGQEKEKGQEAKTTAGDSRQPGLPAGLRLQLRQALMSRILLADDSPHAQRMGERILREEGYRSGQPHRWRGGADALAMSIPI